MDGSRFDALAKVLSVPDSRRRVLGLLAAVPVVGGLLGVAEEDAADAKDRRRRRKQRHKKRKDKSQGKDKQKTCKPQSANRICAGKCGEVTSRQTCGKTVDCGSCDCTPPCGECFTCEGAAGTPGTCVPQVGAPCGEAATCAGGMLQPQGSCNGSGVCEAADSVSCEPYVHCAGNACATSCIDDNDCVNGSFCQDGTCVGDGDNGDACRHDGQCKSGHCVEQVCCDSACPGECQACNLPGAAGTCTPWPVATPCGAEATCTAGTSYPQSSCDGSGACEEADPVPCAPYRCDGNACGTICREDSACVSGYFCNTDRESCVPKRTPGTVCSRDAQCASGHCVDDVCCNTACAGECEACNVLGSQGTCTSLTGTTCGDGNICCSGTCQECCNDTQCKDASRPYCVAGVCAACHVPCDGDPMACGEALRAALAGNRAMLHLCPGTYQGGFQIRRDVTIIGAGEGEDPASNTILDGGGTQRVFNISDANVTLRKVRITHGNGSEGNAGTDGGGGIRQWGGALTMEDATVANNTGRAAGGIMINAPLTMTRCTVRENVAPADHRSAVGGGLYLMHEATLTDCLIVDNTCDGSGGGIHLGTNASLVLTGETLVRGNEAVEGGGIYSSIPGHHSVTIGQSCRITRNTAQNGLGGGIQRVSSGQVILQGPHPSPIVVDNCHENCAVYRQDPIAGCAAGGSCPA